MDIIAIALAKKSVDGAEQAAERAEQAAERAESVIEDRLSVTAEDNTIIIAEGAE